MSLKTVYLLSLAGGKFYVGKSGNINKRINSHLNGHGSKWTQIFPVEKILLLKDVPSEYSSGYETFLTCKMLYEQGINTTRGAEFCIPRYYDKRVIKPLSYVISHHLDLDQKHVHLQLIDKYRMY